MKINWERNSRVIDLIRSGKVDDKDMIPKTSTDNFPDGAATVRMSDVRAKNPFVTLHIKGAAKKGGSPHSVGWSYSNTLRVNMGGCYGNMMSPNGELCDTLTWLDVHDAVEKVKEVMGL